MQCASVWQLTTSTPSSFLSGKVLVVVYNFFRFCFLLSLFAALILTALVTAKVRPRVSSHHLSERVLDYASSSHTHHTHTHAHTQTHTHHTTLTISHSHSQSTPPPPPPLACVFRSRCSDGLLLPHLPDVAGRSDTFSAGCCRQKHNFQEGYMFHVLQNVVRTRTYN